MAAVTRTATEWLLVDMAAASVHRYAGAQFSRAGRGGIYLHEKTAKAAFATESLSTSEATRLSGSLRIGAKDALMVDMAAASVHRYADAQFSEAWRNVGLYFHSAHAVSSFAWDSLSTSETTDTGAVRRSAFESLRIDMAAVTVRRYATAQFSSGWRNPGIYIHGPEGFRLPAESLVISQSVSRTLVAGRFVTETLTISETARVTRPTQVTDTLTVSENLTRGIGMNRTCTESLSVAEVATKAKVTARAATDSLLIVQSVARLLSALRSSSDALTFTQSVSPVFGNARVASEMLHISESVSVIAPAHLSRFATDALVISEAVVVGATAQISRFTTESLHTAEVVSRTQDHVITATDALTVTCTSSRSGSWHRTLTDLLVISESLVREGADRLRFTTDFSHTSELVTGTRIAGTFIYFLPFPSGNLPVISNLHGSVADGMFRNVVTDGELAVPIADSLLFYPVAGSQLAAQQAISSLIMQRADGNLAYVDP